jgi:hypothetical protein
LSGFGVDSIDKLSAADRKLVEDAHPYEAKYGGMLDDPEFSSILADGREKKEAEKRQEKDEREKELALKAEMFAALQAAREVAKEFSAELKELAAKHKSRLVENSILDYRVNNRIIESLIDFHQGRGDALAFEKIIEDAYGSYELKKEFEERYELDVAE